MPRGVCDINKATYFHYKLTYDNSGNTEYYTTQNEIIKKHPELTKRIIYKYTCTDNKAFVPRENRRVKRGYWIEKIRKLIVRGDDYIRVNIDN